MQNPYKEPTDLTVYLLLHPRLLSEVWRKGPPDVPGVDDAWFPAFTCTLISRLGPKGKSLPLLERITSGLPYGLLWHKNGACLRQPRCKSQRDLSFETVFPNVIQTTPQYQSRSGSNPGCSGESSDGKPLRQTDSFYFCFNEIYEMRAFF